MKHKLTLLAVLLTATVLPAVAQNKRTILKNPDEASWAIQGRMESRVIYPEDTTEYELLNPRGAQHFRNTGGHYIEFRRDPHYYGIPMEKSMRYRGIRAEKEQVFFTLHNAETNHPNGFNDSMYFWTWVPEAGMGGEWQLDKESGSGHIISVIDSNINIMLVLDCSESMRDSLPTLQREAKYFLHRLCDASVGKGNVRVGVTGFSTVEYSRSHTIPPLPLTSENCTRLCKFIDTLSAGGGTALYYSTNAAVKSLQEDYKQNLQRKPYSRAIIIAFTDGLDNTSLDLKTGCENNAKYYNYTLDYYPRQMVNNKKILSYCIGMRGKDITSSNVWKATVEKMQTVFGRGNYYPISHIEEMHGVFEKIIAALIERHTMLELRVAKGITGKVGWTFREEGREQREQEEREQEESKFWLGIGVEGGRGYSHSESDSLNRNSDPLAGAALRLDFAYSFNSSFAMGLTGSIGAIGENPDWVFRIGPLAKFTLSNGSAILAGFGFQNWAVKDTPVYVTLGWKFKSPWYINATINGFEEPFSFCIGVGYSVLGGRKK